MPVSSGDFTGKLPLLTKNFLLAGDQNLRNLIPALNSTNLAFHATNGYGAPANATSTMVLVASGGYPDQRCVNVLHYETPTATGSEDMSTMLRCSYTYDHLLARVHLGVASIGAVLAGGAIVTLISSAFAVAQGADVTIDFQAVGTALTAVFTSTGVAGSPLTLNATDTVGVPQGGLMGWRSLSANVYNKSVSWSQR